MLLKQITLHNIRSYRDETVTFPNGSTLLSGDIGCGKSSILLAIEFALFGTARPDLPGEALLRKGTTSGFVELVFSIQNKNVTIRRTLTKEKDIIKQSAGHIIIDSVKKELTPVELKAEVVHLLGYPEEFITKNKNYIFRYTVYTPQEEMKFILQENPDIRLDVLRKIFNIDKYKNIRENVQLYLKKTRTWIAILNTKTEPLEIEKTKCKRFHAEKEQIQNELEHIIPQLHSIQENIVKNNEQRDQFEKEHTLFRRLQQELSLKNSIKIEKKRQYDELQLKEEKLKSTITQFLFSQECVTETIQQEIHELEYQKSVIVQQKTSLQEKCAYTQRTIQEKQTELKKYKDDVSVLEEKQTQHKDMKLQLETKDTIQKKKVQLQELFEKTSEIITKNKTILSHSRDIYQKIDLLDVCPTCLQSVSPDHKEKTKMQEKSKIDQAENLLFELNKKKSEIVTESKIVTEKIEELVHAENLSTRIALEIEHLQKKQQQIDTIHKSIVENVKENNELMQQLKMVSERHTLEQNNEILQQKRTLLQQLTERDFIEQQIKDIVEQKTKGMQDIILIEKELANIQEQQKTVHDVIDKVEQCTQENKRLLTQERALAVTKAEFDIKNKHITQQIQESEKIVAELTEMKNKLVRMKEVYAWLDTYFIALTLTIEKHVLVHIHQLFNQLFQEWFSILIDDDQMYAHIDDSFSPVVEQNGYEISFSNLSGGERTSASLAYRLALNKVINDIIHQINTKNIIILDEPTDGFSSEQLDKVRDVLEGLNLQQTIIVSHESKIESFVENVIHIRKEDGKSVVC
ncbi:hypothetical protein COV17_03780 [Candidatus Woesearchaeota archaeon CG10_big_fil_rev_8_21_14_0_10_36_11]|nr:MAG: hypothetical protein COV17_03780 [Candidatus Woesearchaeota archaeon CG10_big_fil_rev_8_21_14_0_10_36_11]